MLTLADYIVKIDGAVPDDLCAAILAEYAGTDEWIHPTMNGTYAPEVRNCMSIEMSAPDVIAKNKDVRAQLDAAVFEVVAKAAAQYTARFPRLKFNSDTGYSLLRYEEGQYIRCHVDTGAQQQRVVSCSLQLNGAEDFVGGNWRFFEDDPMCLTQDRGDAVLFPSNFCYPHEIEPVQLGVRYSIITWLSLKPEA